MSVNDKVLDAIEMLTSAAVDNAKYNKTIQAQIIGCVDSKTGKYKCNYLDTTFYAYSDTDARYSKGTSVYILIPDNDMSREKIILGAVKKLGEDYVSVVSEQDRWELISNNCCDSSNKIWKLTTDNNVLKLNDNVVSNNIYSQVTIDNKLKNYIVNNADDVKILLGVTVQTFLSEDKQKQGHYGIRFTLNFKNNIQRVYTLDENNMISNPYQLINPTRQFQVFEIDAENFESISSIEIFSSDFTPDGETDDIWFKDIQIYAVRAYTPEQLQGTFISFLIPSGLYFTNNENSKIITAQIKENGSLVEYNDNMNFYWGIEDTRITSIDDEGNYHRYLGNGWKWINNTNIQQHFLELAKTSAINSKTKIKVVVDYNDVIYTKEVVIYNEAASNTVSINCSAGTTEFYYNAGSPTLTCTVTGTAASQTLHYYWIGKYSLEDSFHSIASIQNHPEQVIIPISQIVTAGQFKCSVYQVVNSEEIEVGTASITLTNSLKTKDEFTLVIYNKDAVFQYDEDGVAPNNSSRENPLKIQALSFELFNSVGQSIDINSIPEIIWQIPKENTLLKIDTSLDVSTNNDSNYIIKNQANLTYDIETRFNMHKQNNQIKLTVKYGSSTITAYTNFTFVKEGDPGTNGTGILFKMIPNTQLTNKPLYNLITWKNSSPYLNYGINNNNAETLLFNNQSTTNWFTDKIWKDGSFLNDMIYSVSIKTITGHNIDSSKLSFDNSGIFKSTQPTFPDNLNNTTMSSNFLQFNITVNSKKYFYTVPICIATGPATVLNNNYKLDIRGGFKYVTYENDGTRPQYDDSLPFEFVLIDVSNNSETILTGYVFTQGQLSLISPNNSNNFTIKPNEKYDGSNFNNGILFVSNNYNIKIFIPVYFSLNQYGFSNLNDWDGNSIDINTNGDYIIFPQIAAGNKNNQTNTFTGVVMGELKVGSGSSNTAGTGLFGFAEGIQTFSLDSNTGKLVLGKASSGNKITIDPSGNMGISYSNGNFSVDTNGNLTAKNASLTGSLSVTGTLSAGSNFSVSSSGYLTAASGKIGNWTISDGGISHSNGTYISSSGSIYNNGSNGYSYSLGSGGAFSAYKATITGNITATSGSIGGWTIDSDLYSSYGMHIKGSTGVIYTGNHSSLASTANGFYLDETGLSIGQYFSVDQYGYLTAKQVNLTSTSNTRQLRIDTAGQIIFGKKNSSASSYTTALRIGIDGVQQEEGLAVFDAPSIAFNSALYIQTMSGTVIGYFDSSGWHQLV